VFATGTLSSMLQIHTSFKTPTHMCQAGVPRAKCGPPRLFMWSVKPEFKSQPAYFFGTVVV